MVCQSSARISVWDANHPVTSDPDAATIQRWGSTIVVSVPEGSNRPVETPSISVESTLSASKRPLFINNHIFLPFHPDLATFLSCFKASIASPKFIVSDFVCYKNTEKNTTFEAAVSPLPILLSLLELLSLDRYQILDCQRVLKVGWLFSFWPFRWPHQYGHHFRGIKNMVLTSPKSEKNLSNISSSWCRQPSGNTRQFNSPSFTMAPNGRHPHKPF